MNFLKKHGLKAKKLACHMSIRHWWSSTDALFFSNRFLFNKKSAPCPEANFDSLQLEATRSIANDVIPLMESWSNTMPIQKKSYCVKNDQGGNRTQDFAQGRSHPNFTQLWAHTFAACTRLGVISHSPIKHNKRIHDITTNFRYH